jgi:hypothetical protein
VRLAAGVVGPREAVRGAAGLRGMLGSFTARQVFPDIMRHPAVQRCCCEDY